jgi:hypothetical protein
VSSHRGVYLDFLALRSAAYSSGRLTVLDRRSYRLEKRVRGVFMLPLRLRLIRERARRRLACGLQLWKGSLGLDNAKIIAPR